MCFENGLPRQSADWLAMTGFFDGLKRNGLRRFFFFRNASPSVSVYMGEKIKQLVYKYPLLLSGGLYYNSKLPV